MKDKYFKMKLSDADNEKAKKIAEENGRSRQKELERAVLEHIKKGGK